MSEGRVARITEVIAGSPTSFDEAIKRAFDRATKTLRNITGMKVIELRVNCENANLLLAKRSFPSTHGNGSVGDISVGGSGDKPVQPKSPPPKQPSNPKSTNYNEVLPDFVQLPNLLPK